MRKITKEVLRSISLWNAIQYMFVESKPEEIYKNAVQKEGICTFVYFKNRFYTGNIKKLILALLHNIHKNADISDFFISSLLLFYFKLKMKTI